MRSAACIVHFSLPSLIQLIAIAIPQMLDIVQRISCLTIPSMNAEPLTKNSIDDRMIFLVAISIDEYNEEVEGE